MFKVHRLSLFSSIPFYGNAKTLVNLLSKERPTQSYPTLKLNWRQRCDLELLVNGSLTPLNRYMDKKTYNSVCVDCSLPNGILFPIPFVLEIPKELRFKDMLNLEDESTGELLATVRVTDLWEADKQAEIALYGGDPEHPEIQRINALDCLYAGAEIVSCYQTQKWKDFNQYRCTPTQMREQLKQQNLEKVVAFQTRNPMHFAHIELVKRAAKEHDCAILLQPVSGPTKEGDIDYVTRMKAYDAVLPYFDNKTTILNLLPLAMRMGGPREALLHCIIRQNYGASHFIIGRDHAGPGSNSQGKDFYAPYAARDTVLSQQDKFNIKPIPFDMVVYVEKDKKYYLDSEVKDNTKTLKLSGTEVRKRLRTEEDIPEWFSPPEVVNILRSKFQNDKWNEINKQLKNPKEIIQHAYDTFGQDVAISFSGAEDVILLEYAKQLGLKLRIFSLDTGRLHPETYRLFEEVEKHYNIHIEYCFPNKDTVEQLVRKKGMFSFYKDGHNECCNIRKVQPLRKQLSGLRAWITGMRKDQNVTRTEVPYVVIDQTFSGEDGKYLVKYNPLSNMKSSEVWEDIKCFGVPYNKLHERGFISIGCEPCTKTTLPNDHEREGRWWWEEATQKECGLHKKKQ